VYAQNAFVNILLVYLLLFVSGSSRYNLASDKLVVIILFVSVFMWYLYTDRKISSSFLLYLTTFIGLLFMLSLYTGGSLSVASAIKTSMNLLLAYLILRTVGKSFTEIYIRLVVFLAAISLFGYMVDMFQLFEGLVTGLPRVGDMGYEGFLYTFRHSFHPFRNNSIYFEPGAYQAFLNAAIFLIVFAKNGIRSRSKWIYIAILVAALATTRSTTGYLIFMVLFFLFLYKSDMATYMQKMFSVGLILIVATIYSAQFYSTLVVKLSDYFDPDETRKGWSAENRSFDVRTDFIIIKKHVFGLGYKKYNEEFRLIGRLDAAEGSSNGISSLLASYGLPFGLFVLVSYFWALKVMLNDVILATAAYIMLIMFLWGESYYKMAPITLAIVAAAFVFYGTRAEAACITGKNTYRESSE